MIKTEREQTQEEVIAYIHRKEQDVRPSTLYTPKPPMFIGCTPYSDLEPQESWKDRALRTQGELIGDLQNRVSELEHTLRDILKQIDAQAVIIERLQPRPWRDYHD